MAPRSVLLHGSRSGLVRSTAAEFASTVSYAEHGADGKGWNVTIGDDVIAEHIPLERWGWHARAASQWYYSVEFAQGTVNDAISDAQVRAFAWWFRHRVLERWPGLYLVFPTHAEVEARGETGKQEGHTDTFPVNDARADDLRQRIWQALEVLEP